jgi:predicted Zn finger-like uncharacterized protein
MEIVCPTCNAAYRLPDDKVPSRRAAARCKRCNGKIIIEPGPQPTATPGPDGAVSELSRSQKAEPAVLPPRPRRDPEADLVAFIGPNAARYLDKFKRIDAKGGGRLAVTWHWPAALIGVWWLLYRKLYLWALVAFIVSFIPVINIGSIFIFGILGNTLYYRHALKTINALRAELPDDDLTITLKQLGGVNRWVVTVGIVLSIITLAGILAAIVIPAVTKG